MRLFFLGTGGIGEPALRHLLHRPGVTLAGVITQPDRPAGRKRELRASPIKEIALAHGVPLLQPNRIRDPLVLESIASWQPDLAVCMAYGQLLPPTLLAMPPLGCINLHASLLPKHRGAAPIQAAILAGDPETGITVMQMEAGLDTGPLLLARRTPIGPCETAGMLHDRLAGIAAEALEEALDQLTLGPVTWQPQEEALASYAPKLTAAAAQLDWHRPAPSLARQIRAMLPWPGAWTLLPAPGGAQKLKIHRATPLPDGAAAMPGTLLAVGPSGVETACGEGRLRLEALQIEGRRVLEARDFLNGWPLTPGLTFLPLEVSSP